MDAISKCMVKYAHMHLIRTIYPLDQIVCTFDESINQDCLDQVITNPPLMINEVFLFDVKW